MRVREFDERDLPGALKLLKQAWAHDQFSPALLKEKLFADPPGESSLALVMADAKRPAGFIAAAAGRDTAWIKLGAVGEGYTGKGCLRQLVGQVEDWARHGGARWVRIMDHPGNYWTPGLDTRYRPAIGALKRLGFRWNGENHNLACPAKARAKSPKLEGKVRVRRVTDSDADTVIELARRFHASWGWEVERALDGKTPTAHVAVSRNRPVGFAVFDANNRGSGSFGPAATLQDWRGRGIGTALLVACLKDIAKAGHKEATIQWPAKTTLYERLNATVAARYAVLTKKLR